MKTTTLNIYTCSELNDKAKEKAHQRWSEHTYYHDHDDNAKSLKEFCEHFGIRCSNWEYDTYNHSYSFSIDNEDIETLSGKKLYSHIARITESLKPFKTYYKTSADGKRMKRTSKILKSDYIEMTGYCADLYFFDSINNYLNERKTDITFKELMNEALNDFFKYCSDDYRHSMSLEYFEEESEANEWEYFSNGELFSEGSYEMAS